MGALVQDKSHDEHIEAPRQAKSHDKRMEAPRQDRSQDERMEAQKYKCKEDPKISAADTVAPSPFDLPFLLFSTSKD